LIKTWDKAFKFVGSYLRVLGHTRYPLASSLQPGYFFVIGNLLVLLESFELNGSVDGVGYWVEAHP